MIFLGYVTALDALSCGRVCHALGAGRSIPSDNINMGVGLEIHVQVGDKTTQGQLNLLRFRCNHYILYFEFSIYIYMKPEITGCILMLQVSHG